MRLGDLIECAQCFTWSGYEDEYPCPNCGYELDAETFAVAPADSPKIPIQEPVRPAPERTAAAAEPAATAVLTVVQCAICDSEVPAGATCKVCNNPLEAR